MSLVPMRAILEATEKYNYAQGAFNVNAVAQAKAVIEVHEMFRSAAIIQGADLANAFMGGRTDFANGTLEDKKVGANNIAKAVKQFAEASPIPVALHLDHGKTVDSCIAAMDGGYTSVMIDGSHHVFEENIEITKSVVRACHAAGIPVEAELGKVGGKEDDLDGGNGNGYTVPSEAAEFAERTGVDSLAVAIGTAHGVYKGTPKLDIERLSEIRKVVSVPLVLHGTSGVPDDAVRECVARGMCKVNYATDLRIAFSKGLKEYLAKDPEVFDPKKYSAVGREYVKEYVKSKILVCGSNGKA